MSPSSAHPRPARGVFALRRTRGLSAAVMGVALCTPGADAQQVSPARSPSLPPSAPTFTRIDQMVDDVDPLRTSMRYLSTDLRQSTAFRDVFRVEGMNSQRFGFSNAGGGELLARVDGAVTAVFPQSVYVPTRDGVEPLIPPGTIFFIGGIPADWFGGERTSAPPSPPSPTRVDSRVDMRAEAYAARQAAARSPRGDDAPQGAAPARDERRPTTEPERIPAPTIMTDEMFRRSTVRGLLMKAVDAKAPPEAVPAPPAKPDTPAPEKEAAPVKPERR